MSIRRTTLVLTSAAIALGSFGLTPAQAAPAKDYIAGDDNPMCIKTWDEDGRGKDCLKVSDTTVVIGQSVRFTGTFGFTPEPGREWCLARSAEAYGSYAGIAACSTVNANGTITIVAKLGKPGTYYYDLGDPACLALPPAKRPPRTCGDDGGVTAMPVKVTTTWS